MGWTIESVKAALPDVGVRMGGRLYRGTVSGRGEAYASVHITGQQLRGQGNAWQRTLTYSWDAIVESLNTNGHLQG